MRDSFREFTPYEGDDPYLYFAFAEADSRKVREYLRLLYERGCRVWYSCGIADGPEEVLRRQARYRGAALTLVYLSDEACRDQNTKSSVLVNQKFDGPIICLDPDGRDRVLAMGLRESVPHIPLYRIRSREELEDAIFHAEGFSQELLGEPVKIRRDSILPKLSLVLCALAVVLSVLFFTGVKESVTDVIQVTDEVELGDPVLLSAVRKAAGGGAVTQELVENLKSVDLSGMPESWDDLALLPSLEEIRIPQEALLGGEPLPEGEYTIILTGGGT
ncbi:MAG: hypothetical protein IJX83_11385 [Lachnospiraceae bacterium]|nr:hypothetical protein [Lachnospiraceae bacterium]